MDTVLQALIFDMDGTLVESERVHWQAWHDTLADHGLQTPSFEEFKKYVGMSDEQVAEDFSESGGRALDPSELLREKSVSYLQLIPQIRLLPGVRDTIDRYRERYPLAVASSSPYGDLIAILEHHKLLHHFSCIIGGDMVPHKKPEPDIYLLATSRMSVSPSACVAFEDSHSGVSAAKTAGLMAVAVPHSMSLDHDFSRADAILGSMSEVDDVLLQRLTALGRPAPEAVVSVNLNRPDRAGMD